MQLLVGTSGYSYKEWRGVFYPEKLASAEWLRFYAERLGAVEINNTFYRLPSPSVLESWAARVPPDFRFSIKASRRITHFKRIADAGEETAYLLQLVAALGERLGALLFQLPPNLGVDLARLEAFQALLPPGMPAAFEFRHPSWSDDRVLEQLRARDHAWVIADTDDAPAEELLATSSRGYLRLRRSGYPREELSVWARRILAAPWKEALVFFKHEDAGEGPRMAQALAEAAERAQDRQGTRSEKRPSGRPGAG